MILNIVYSPDEAHKSTQLIHRLISKVLRENGWQVTDYFMVEAEYPATASGVFPIITSSRLTRRRGIRKFLPSGLTAKLSKLVDCEKSQFVVCDGLGVARQMFPVLKNNPNLKLIVSVHGFVKFKPRDLANFQMYSDRAKLVLVSSSLAGEICSHYPILEELVSVIPNTLEPEFVDNLLPKAEARALLRLPDLSKLYVAVSRLSSKKDVATVVRAYAKLPADNSYLVIMGDGPCRLDLEFLVSELGLGDRVIWLGWVKSSSQYLKAFDVFVSASRAEGFGLSVFEARAAGLPVVCSNIAPHREALNGDGLFFEPGDVESCAEKLSLASSFSSECDLHVKYQQFAAAYENVFETFS